MKTMRKRRRKSTTRRMKMKLKLYLRIPKCNSTRILKLHVC